MFGVVVVGIDFVDLWMVVVIGGEVYCVVVWCLGWFGIDGEVVG